MLMNDYEFACDGGKILLGLAGTFMGEHTCGKLKVIW